MNRLLAKAVLMPIAFGPLLMRADVVFSNVNGAFATNGDSVCGSGVSQTCLLEFAAEGFTPSATYTMTDAQVLVGQIFGTNSTFDVFLYSDNSGVPGSSIEQIGSGLIATSPGGSLITANTISTPITLVSGTPYWLVLEPHQASSGVFWGNDGSPLVPFSRSLDGGNTWSGGENDDQFQIDGKLASVPEPSGFALFVGIVILLCGTKRTDKERKH